MAIKTWQGGASVVQQVATWTISSNTNGHSFTLAVEHPSGTTGQTVTICSETGNGILTTDQLATALALDWSSSSHKLATAVAASATGSTITFTANTAGIPFIVTKGGTGTSTLTTTVANSGPQDWKVPS